MADNLLAAAKKDLYLNEYVEELKKKTKILPKYFENLTVKELADIRKNATADPESANLIYRCGTGFVHIDSIHNRYLSIEHKLTDTEKDKLHLIKEAILDKASSEESCETKEDLVRILNKLFDASVEVNEKSTSAKQKKMGKVSVSKKEYDILKYYINRDIVGFGPIEPLILDPYIEDIHLIGTVQSEGLPQGFPIWPGNEYTLRR